MKTNCARLNRASLCMIAATAVLLAVGCQRQSSSSASCCSTNEALISDTAAADNTPEAKTREEVFQDPMFTGEWKAPGQRRALSLSHKLTRHDGAGISLNELVGKPMAISFAYTRCMNPKKCRLVTTTMGELRKRVQAAGLLDKVKLVLITYDAQYDTPEVMCDYAKRQGLELDEQTLFLRPPIDPEYRLFRDLGVNASFNPAGVTIHGIQLLLIDKSGKLARGYRTLIWDNEQVVKELAQLAQE